MTSAISTVIDLRFRVLVMYSMMGIGSSRNYSPPTFFSHGTIEATDMRREPVWALREQNERWGAVFLERVGRLYKICLVAVDLAAWCPPPEH
jgi:hypothetical protein